MVPRPENQGNESDSGSLHPNVINNKCSLLVSCKGNRYLSIARKFAMVMLLLERKGLSALKTLVPPKATGYLCNQLMMDREAQRFL